MLRALKYYYVTGGKNNLNFHAWLSDINNSKIENRWM